MIKKIYNLKKMQIEQHSLIKQQFVSKIDNLREQINTMQYEINTKSVDRFGAIRDFYLLEMHKKTLKDKIQDCNTEIFKCNQEIQKQEKIIADFMKEKEQFNYILEQKKKEKIAKELKDFEDESSELIQYRYIHG